MRMKLHNLPDGMAQAGGVAKFVLLPPPNVTGDLHLGHGFSFTLLDTYVRFLRNRGETVHFHPGTEHAGSRAEIAYARFAPTTGEKPDFLAWQDSTRKSIIEQIKLMGVEADWADEYNSMDRQRVQFIRGAFAQLSKDGFIYRSVEMVNWCPCCNSSVPDIDVKFAKRKSAFYQLSPPDGKPAFTIATFGLERLLSASALAISAHHPHADELDGRSVSVFGRDIPIRKIEREDIAAATYLIAINPQVNPVDFRAAAAPVAGNLYGKDGNLSDDYRQVRGDSLQSSREALAAKLREEGWNIHSEAIDYQTPFCAVCNSDVHPMISEQWYFNIEKGLACTSRTPEFHSALWKKGFELWLEKLRRPLRNDFHEVLNTSHYGGFSSNQDFLVSSQSGWGQQLPVQRCVNCAEAIVTTEEPGACRACGCRHFQASSDVISIFFSCCLMGASANPSQLKQNAVDFTICGHDIYHYWGSLKNILACALGYEAGFGSLMVHGLLVDQSGEKMTKSKGNVIGLTALVEQYGIDALRAMVYECIFKNHDRPFIKFDIADFAPTKAYVSRLHASLLDSEIQHDADDSIADTEIETLRIEVEKLMENHKIGHAYKRLLAILNTEKITFKTASARNGFFKLIYPFHPSLRAGFGGGENE